MNIHTLRREQRLPGIPADVLGVLERIFDYRAEHVLRLLGAARPVTPTVSGRAR
jgi:hypothetical protein